MDKFVRNLLTEWRRLELPFAGAAFVVAVSGGADSVALLLAIDDLRKRNKLNDRFVAAHFNHDLRGAESDADADFVRDLCARLDFELVAEKGSVAEKGNLEQNARLARYEFLLETARRLSADAVLTAHTVNDQAETFLLNLLRGSGLGGLAAMRPVTADFRLPSSAETRTGGRKPQNAVALARPLLEWATRAGTENYCNRRAIVYRNDTMNEDEAFSRVRVRKKLIPLLEEFNPRALDALAKTARLLRNDFELIEAVGIPATNAQTLSVKRLNELPRPMFIRTIRRWLAARRGDLRGLELVHYAAIERLATSRKSGRIVELPGGEEVEKKGGQLFFVPKR